MDYAILIASAVSLVLTVLACLFRVSPNTLRYTIIAVLALTVLFSLEFYLIQFGNWPITAIPVLGCLITLRLLRPGRGGELKRYALSMFVLHALLLLFAVELAKSSMNTWGSGPVYTGVFMIIYILPLFQLLQLAHRQDRFYGWLKAVTGSAALLVIAIFGFSSSDYNGESVSIIRDGIVLLGVFTVVEGLLLVFRNAPSNPGAYNLP